MSTINIGTSSTTAFKVESDTTGALTIKTGAGLTTAVTVDASQRVMVGTGSSSAWGGGPNVIDIGSMGALVGWNSSQQTDIWSNAYFDGADSKYKTSTTAGLYRIGGGAHTWYTAASGTAGNAITWTTAMSLNSSGVLLGYGLGTVNGVSNVVASFGGGQTAAILVNSYSDAGKQFGISNNNGNTSIWSGNGATGFNLFQNTSSWSAYSDARLKNITGRYENAVQDIMQIDAIKFTLKSDEDQRPRVGVTAQSVLPVVPEAVNTYRLPKDVGDDDAPEYLTVAYTDLIPIMIAAIKELAAEVAALKGNQ